MPAPTVHLFETVWCILLVATSGMNQQESELELDRDFFVTLRDIKPLTDGKIMEEHKMYVVCSFKSGTVLLRPSQGI